MKVSKRVLLFACLVGLSYARSLRCEVARGWEGTIDLPTYALGEEDPNPPFPLVTRHQIYPYTMLDDLTDRQEVKTYRAIYLENEYLKAIILPEVGGRLYSLFDKISKREVFYRNNVVKYGLVALRGAWISGGIEFNFPNGHTTATVSPVSSRILAAGPDKASAAVGGMDWVSGMYWQVELTLHSGEARLEQRVTLFNPTPQEQLYWYWANAAVPATPDMQFIYPMREANPHSRTEIWTYPVWEGVDYSWYKNIRQPTSLFGLAVHRNFFGAYYHDSDYGVVHWADYHDVPGKKIWSWGVAGDGLIWTDLLTDHDGPYNEIQSGRFETQLSQEFMPPHHVESWTEYWYPVRGLGGGFVEATNELALNVKFVSASRTTPQHIELAVDPTVETPSAKIKVMLAGKLLREFGPIALGATMTAKFSVPVEKLDSARKSLSVEIDGVDSKPMLRWSAADPIDGNNDFVSAAGVHDLTEKPLDKMTAEEIYLRGIEEEKNGSAEDAEKTYEHVLQRDPMYIPALLKLAMRDYQAADLDAALAKIATAKKRDNTNPAVQYAVGLIYRAQGDLTKAQDAFWRSLQFNGPPSAALAQLGEIAIQLKNYEEAERLLRRSLSYNPDDTLVLSESSVALRNFGARPDSKITASLARAEMELVPFVLSERARHGDLPLGWKRDTRDAVVLPDTPWRNVFRQDFDYVEVGSWYRSLGDLQSSDEILQKATRELIAGTVSPMVYYYLSANAWQEGKHGDAAEFAAKASSAPHDKIFPQRLSDALVLKKVIAQNPNDAHAHYFLGTFLFAHDRYDDAAKEWLVAKKLGFDDPILECNLGVYEWRVKKDLPEAAAYYEKSIRLAPANYRLYPDLDEIFMQMGDQAAREKLFAAAPAEVLGRDTVRARHALFLVEQHRFDQAAALLADHHFDPWEGGQIIREIFVLDNLEKGRQALEAKKYVEAEHAFRQALEYPVNLGVGKPDKPHDEEAWYWLGVALDAEGKSSSAHEAWQVAASEGRAAGGVPAVFAGAALQKLGNQTEAEQLLTASSIRAPESDAGAHSLYVAGLAERFRNHEQAAQIDFRKATELDPLLWQARFELDRRPGIRK